MRIDLTANLLAAAEAAGRSSKTQTRAVPPRKGSETDGEHLASDQLQLRSLENRVNALPEVRQEKVEALGKAMRNGTYEAPPEKTAEAMIAAMTAASGLR